MARPDQARRRHRRLAAPDRPGDVLRSRSCPTYIQAYKPEWLPDSSSWRWIVKIAADVIFIASLFVLGGDFWDKLHALFVREARVTFPGPARRPAQAG